MQTGLPYYREVLQTKLSERIARNPRYSLRSFAQHLGIQPGALSQILSGKRYLSPKAARKLFTLLSLTPEQETLFIQSILQARIQGGAQRLSRDFALTSSASQVLAPKRELSLELFRTISEWYHYAILELTTVDHFKPDLKWISQKLGITQMEAKLAVQRLFDLELLEVQDGKWVKTHLKVDTLDKGRTTTAHRMRQKQLLEKSIESLENDPIEHRNHSAVTFALDPKKIPEIKNKIQKFMWQIADEYSATKRERVVELIVNLIPLSKEKNV